MSRIGAAPRAAVPVSNARAAASRKNGAKSRGPNTEEGRARSAQNALKHGMRARKHLVLPDEDGAEFAALEAALVAELQPVGALQIVLARRVAVAAWRLARADRIEAELFEERRSADGGLGLALIRDGNGARSFETLLRYRGAAMAEFWRALRTLKALQAEDALGTDALLSAQPVRPTARQRLADRAQPNEPERPGVPPLEYLPGEPPASGALHEPAAPWLPNEPETDFSPRGEYLPSEPTAPGGTLHEPTVPWLPNEPERGADRRRAHLNQLPSSMEPATGLSARPTSDPRSSPARRRIPTLTRQNF